MYTDKRIIGFEFDAYIKRVGSMHTLYPFLLLLSILLALMCASIYELIHYRLSTSCWNWFKIWDLVQSSKLWITDYSLQINLYVP